MNTCKNCERTFEENFCGHCGQAKIHRITFGHVVHDFFHVFTHADKGILQLLPKIIIRPGETARQYLQGKRTIYNPFQYLVIVIGLNILALTSSDIFDKVAHNAMESVKHLPELMRTGLGNYFVFLQKYTTLISLITLPIYAYFSKVFFKGANYNLGEHLTIQVFANAQLYTINLLALLFFIIFDLDAGSTFYVVVLMLICYGITYKQAFELRWPRAVLKTLLAFAVSYLVQLLLMMLFALLFILYVVLAH